MSRELSRADEYVVTGAHFDHLGRSTIAALDADARDAIRPGADDNVSGSAAVPGLGPLSSAQSAMRTPRLVHFSGDKAGRLGSPCLVGTFAGTAR